jgi:hypothetical protein
VQVPSPAAADPRGGEAGKRGKVGHCGKAGKRGKAGHFGKAGKGGKRGKDGVFSRAWPTKPG